MLAPMPRLVSDALRDRPRAFYYAAWGTIAALVISCFFVAVRSYPWYFPYVNALGAGKPAYTLMADSNVDWKPGFAGRWNWFAERRQLKDLALDSYGISDDVAYVPQSHAWDCQAPTRAEAGNWVVVSANMILDGRNCGWLLRYPQEELAGGSMYAFHLPADIPADGAPGGPPLQADRRMFLGMPFDFKVVMLGVVRHPETIPDVMKQMQAVMAPAQK